MAGDFDTPLSQKMAELLERPARKEDLKSTIDQQDALGTSIGGSSTHKCRGQTLHKAIKLTTKTQITEITGPVL